MWTLSFSISREFSNKAKWFSSVLLISGNLISLIRTLTSSERYRLSRFSYIFNFENCFLIVDILWQNFILINEISSVHFYVLNFFLSFFCCIPLYELYFVKLLKYYEYVELSDKLLLTWSMPLFFFLMRDKNRTEEKNTKFDGLV